MTSDEMPVYTPRSNVPTERDWDVMVAGHVVGVILLDVDPSAIVYGARSRSALTPYQLRAVATRMRAIGVSFNEFPCSEIERGEVPAGASGSPISRFGASVGRVTSSHAMCDGESFYSAPDLERIADLVEATAPDHS